MRLDETSSGSRREPKMYRAGRTRAVASIDLSKELNALQSHRSSLAASDNISNVQESSRDSSQSINDFSRVRSSHLSKTFPVSIRPEFRDSGLSDVESAIYPTPRSSNLSIQSTTNQISADQSKEVANLNPEELTAALEAMNPGLSTSMMDRIGRTALDKHRGGRKVADK